MQNEVLEEKDNNCTSRPTGEVSRSRIALIVPKTLVKKLKDAFEKHGNLDKSVKIRPARPEDYSEFHNGAMIKPRPDSFVVPTRLSVESSQFESITSPARWELMKLLGVTEYQASIDLIKLRQSRADIGFPEFDGSRERKQASSSTNPLARTVYRWLHLLAATKPNLSFDSDSVLSHSWTYMIYPPLLLLPPTFLSNLSSVLDSKGQDLPADLSSLWISLSKELRISHIALNAPIPANAPKQASIHDPRVLEANVLRSPTGLSTLYGNFGLALPPTHNPTTADFTSAFWCTTRQNGIFQTWAPRYSMFSRGNISEKTRVLTFKTLTKDEFGTQPENASVVDLYAGIGYFAFSYAKVKFGKVFCWEINPWSVEGLRRGAKMNHWGIKVLRDPHTLKKSVNEEERFVVFQESNEHAARRIAAVKDTIPPIRHVNCGLLPSSKGSWEVAVQVLDQTGGWIHVHENIAKAAIERRKMEIIEIFNQLAKKYWGKNLEVHWEVKCDHIEQVKSYAPGVMHCVLDLSVLRTG